ncbi:hypothetical protein FRX31_018998 [Thalictrum thalictroides]|uniref:Uncharacterized protein n=1 Tax=Thalictrum thalictroides TaxID=46969 RepID=A0A7J6W213_THATH|nr:hypothetical protein FRX31_018998 [Thalictrum thalictroides]
MLFRTEQVVYNVGLSFLINPQFSFTSLERDYASVEREGERDRARLAEGRSQRYRTHQTATKGLGFKY